MIIFLCADLFRWVNHYLEILHTFRQNPLVSSEIPQESCIHNISESVPINLFHVFCGTSSIRVFCMLWQTHFFNIYLVLLFVIKIMITGGNSFSRTRVAVRLERL